MNQVVPKKIKLNLVGIDGNAFSIMAAFSVAAKKAKWTIQEIDTVFDHLLATFQAPCK